MRTVLKAFILLLLPVTGCTLQPAADTPLSHCDSALSRLHHAIDSAGVRDAQYHPVAGFPTYRSNRFWSDYAALSLTPAQQLAWRRQLHTLGMNSLALEWRNLPAQAQLQWWQDTGFASSADFSAQCSEPLLQHSLQQPLSANAVQIPDAYSTAQRFFGLYALTRFAARNSIADYQREMRHLMAQGEQAWQQPTQVFAPPLPSDEHVPAAPARYSALGIPQYSAQDMQALLRWHAPRWQIEQQSAADLPGTARWQSGSHRSDTRHIDTRHIDTMQPTIYHTITYMRYGEQVLLQLNYLAWFSERPPQTTRDWYAGALDGLIWRVTLKPDGRVLFYDSIHPCGCYHTVHLPQDSTLNIPPQGDEPLLVIATDLPSQARQPVLLVQAGTHYLLRAQAQPAGAPNSTAYRLVEYDQLRSLPTVAGYRNWFDEDGLIATSARAERFYLWPLGVPSAGAMRQQGHHAIAFLGRRHFDEARVETLLALPRSSVPGALK